MRKITILILLQAMLLWLPDVGNGQTVQIGNGSSYATLQEGIDAVIPVTTLTQDLTIEIYAGSYNETIVLPNFTGTNIVTIKSQTNNANDVVIYSAPTLTTNNYIVKFAANSHNYRLENLKIINASTELGIGKVIVFENNSGFSDIIINKCNLFGRTNLTNSTELVSPDYSVIFHDGMGGLTSNNLSIENCTISGGSYSIYAQGASTGDSNTKILYNTFNDFGSQAIYTVFQNGLKIRGNFINGTCSEIANFTKTCISVKQNLSTTADTTIIEKNKLFVTSSATASGFIKGILINNCSDTVIYIKNNFISIQAPASGDVSGIELENNVKTKVFNNSIKIAGSVININTFALKIIDTGLPYYININNVLCNIAGGAAISISELNLFFKSNFNDLYSNTTTNVVQITTPSQSLSLNQWRMQGYDSRSISVDPMYNGTTPYNLHIFMNGKSALSRRGINLPAVTDDIDGQPRVGLNNCIGADEAIIPMLWVGDMQLPYNWNDTVYVETYFNISSSGILNIQPGTKILFSNAGGIDVNGVINANGDVENHIIFDKEPTAAHWNGISHTKIITTGTSYYNFCEFSNVVGAIAGALNINENSVEVRNCKFMNNSANDVNALGGAISVSSANVIIESNHFLNNSTTNSGGAIYVASGNVTINANYFESNHAGNGGALTVGNSITQITNNIFANNSAISGGGGLVLQGIDVSNVLVSNNTFVGNTAPQGYNLYSYNSTTQIQNNIFAGITLDNIHIEGTVSNTVNLNYNDIESGVNSVFTGINIVVNQLGNIYDNPNFNPNTLYNLLPTSKCINASDPNTYYSNFSTDYAGNPRNYDAYPYILDIGAYEFQGNPLIADAGTDQLICNSSTFMNAVNPGYPYIGTWSVMASGIVIAQNHNPNTEILNLLPGTYVFDWSVTDGTITVSDQVMITNAGVYVNAGNDFSIYSPDVTLVTSASLNGNNPSPGTGNWTCSFTDVTFVSPTSNTSVVQNLHYGENVLTWTVSGNGQCPYASDSLVVTIGHSMVPANGVTNLNWNTASDWNLGFVPGPSDSLTIYGCASHLTDGDATCDKLVVGSGATFDVIATGLNTSSLSTNTILIEDNPVKYGKTTPPVVNFHSNTQVNVGNVNQSPPIHSRGNNTAVIIRGGTLIIEQDVEKDKSGRGGPTGLSIGNGRGIVLEESLNFNPGTLTVRSGGNIQFEPNVEVSDPAIQIGANCSLLVESNSSTKAQPFIRVGRRQNIILQKAIAKGNGGTATIRGGTLIIEQDVEKGAKGNNGKITILGGGKLIIEQDVEKFFYNSQVTVPQIEVEGGEIILGYPVFKNGNVEELVNKSARGTATLEINNGGALLVSQDPTDLTSGKISIHSGGQLLIEKGINNIPATSDPAIVLGAGSTFDVISSPSTLLSPPEVIIGRGRDIVLERQILKGNGGTATIRGGTLIIEQDVEKGAKGNNGKITILGGGKLIIEQDVEKGFRSSTLFDAPLINIKGGQMEIGTSVAKGGITTVRGGSLIIEQDVEKGFAAVENLIINPGAVLEIGTAGSPNIQELVIGNGNAVTIKEGGVLNLLNSSNIVLENGSSLLDMNPTSLYPGKSKMNFQLGQHFFSLPFANALVSDFLGLGVLKTWDEPSYAWFPLAGTSSLDAMKAYKIIPSLEKLDVTIPGIINSGPHGLNITSNNSLSVVERGWNLAGNPYPSAIDIELSEFGSANSTVYFFDNIQQNFKLYQKGGISLNGASQYILPKEGFLLQTQTDDLLAFNNSQRVHYFENVMKNTKSVTDYLKFKVTDNVGIISDELAVKFDALSTDDFDTYDALKVTATGNTVPQIFTKVDPDFNMAINTLLAPVGTDTKAIPLKFKAGQIGQYTISTTDINFGVNYQVYIKDLTDNSMHMMNTVSNSFQFNYLISGVERNFMLLIGTNVTGINEVNTKAKVQIYSVGNQIFVNSVEASTIKVYSMLGEEIASYNFASGSNSIQISQTTGTYLVKAITATGTKVQKVHIKK